MTQYNVMPKSGNRKGWKVVANGRTTSRHNSKSTAKNAARSRASRGDTIVIHDRNGRIQSRRDVQ